MENISEIRLIEDNSSFILSLSITKNDKNLLLGFTDYIKILSMKNGKKKSIVYIDCNSTFCIRNCFNGKISVSGDSMSVIIL